MMPLFGLTLVMEHVLIVVLAALVAGGMVGWLLRKDTAFEERQRAYVKLSALLEKWGFKHLAVITENIAIKDLDGVVRETILLARLMQDEEQAMTLLAENFHYQLPLRLERPQDREKLLKAVDDYRATHPEQA